MWTWSECRIALALVELKMSVLVGEAEGRERGWEMRKVVGKGEEEKVRVVGRGRIQVEKGEREKKG